MKTETDLEMAATQQEACQLRNGLSSVSGDCDDGDPNINPIIPEVCDEIDNNCNGTIDEGVTIELSMKIPMEMDMEMTAPLYKPVKMHLVLLEQSGDCDDTNIYINPAIPELCDGLDNDCDSTVDEEDSSDVIYWYADTDGDGYGDPNDAQEGCSAPTGYVLNMDDCDDDSPTVNPGNAEICDEVR